MKLPQVIKRMENTDSQCRIYVEDYVHTYLNELKRKSELLPIRAALFGRVLRREDKCYYFIYGACCVIDEIEEGRCEEQVRNDYFSEYDLIGYVNIYGEKDTEEPKGYYVFYESNEPMQNYLISCYEREKKKEAAKRKKASVKEKKGFDPIDLLKSFLYGVCVILTAIAVLAVNDYHKMQGFTQAAERTVFMADTLRGW